MWLGSFVYKVTRCVQGGNACCSGRGDQQVQNTGDCSLLPGAFTHGQAHAHVYQARCASLSKYHRFAPCACCHPSGLQAASMLSNVSYPARHTLHQDTSEPCSATCRHRQSDATLFVTRGVYSWESGQSGVLCAGIRDFMPIITEQRTSLVYRYAPCSFACYPDCLWRSL